MVVGACAGPLLAPKEFGSARKGLPSGKRRKTMCPASLLARSYILFIHSLIYAFWLIFVFVFLPLSVMNPIIATVGS